MNMIIKRCALLGSCLILFALGEEPQTAAIVDYTIYGLIDLPEVRTRSGGADLLEIELDILEEHLSMPTNIKDTSKAENDEETKNSTNRENSKAPKTGKVTKTSKFVKAKNYKKTQITKKSSKKGGNNNGNLEILIVQTGDYSPTNLKGLLIAEPFKQTHLLLSLNNTTKNIYGKLNWEIFFHPQEDEQWPEELVDTVSKAVDGIIIIGEEEKLSIEYMFKLPGKYTVKVTEKMENSKKHSLSLKKEVAKTEIRVAYARRDVIDLSPQDWDNYVEAVWALKNLSSKEGQIQYKCKHFYNLDVFTVIHGVNSENRTCDQIHFSLMQEQAHHAWMTLLEKALQCVHPSIAMPFYNIAKDFQKYYNSTVGIKSMLDSPIFSSDYYGGGHPNWEDREDLYDPYYVQDGRFANFPLRQNRTGLCDESSGLMSDEVFLPFCKKIMEEPGYYDGWSNSDAKTHGMILQEPRDPSAYKYVSARRWYVYDSVGDTALIPSIPKYAMIANVLTLKNIFEQFILISKVEIHGYAHIAMSGLWGGGIDKSTKTSKTAAVNPDVPILELLKNPTMLRMFAWLDMGTTRHMGCYKCSKEGCEMNTNVAFTLGCWNAPNFAAPDMKKPYWNEYAVRGNSWYNYLELTNVGGWMRFVLYGFSTHYPNSGTFSRNKWANQDPIFYAHHAFTFLVGDLAMKSLEERGIASAPFYGLDMLDQTRATKECPGHNLDDTSVFKNLVRYKTDQESGSQQTWAHILEMWSPERRDYEWIINDDHITDFYSTGSKDPTCIEDCNDSGDVISNNFPTGTDPEFICESVLSQVKQGFDITKEEACYVKFKDIPGLPDWLPDDYDFYHMSCRKTCGYCSPVCEHSKQVN